MFSAATKSAHGPATEVNYIESVFSTWLYTGTGASQTITNNIDLSTKGGMTWIKSMSDATNNNLFDTIQGATKLTHSNTYDATATDANSLTAFNSNGFTLGTGGTAGSEVNVNAATYCSWTFRKQPKFFDVVTWTGNGVAGRAISHSLGSTPGMIIVKGTGNLSNWRVWQRSANRGGVDGDAYGTLNSTGAFALDGGAIFGNNTAYVAPTSTTFTVSSNSSCNANGITYVAYVFAHNAGGFGLTGTDNVISCGSLTTTSGLVAVNLGYEPQYVLVKKTNAAEGWFVYDVMRDMSQTNSRILFPNTSGAELNAGAAMIIPTATGFNFDSTQFGASGNTYIYMAIRRPMKVPTDATTVFSPIVSNASQGTKITTNFPIDSQWLSFRAGLTGNAYVSDRLRANSTTTTSSGLVLNTSSTGAENSVDSTQGWDNTGFQIASYWSSYDVVYWNFSRRPGFFDEVCYTGTGSARTVAHNLGVVPEMMIVKNRGTVVAWKVYDSTGGNTKFMELNDTAGYTTSSTIWNNTTPTSSVFTVGTGASVNQSGTGIVAYLFATCPGVSKVGSYTGNGTTQAIACGFTGGARFVMIKRTDSTGNWYVYDTARGMTTLTDPYLLLNSTAAEAATLGSVTTTTGGFTVNATILAAINTNAASYIFLAIA